MANRRSSTRCSGFTMMEILMAAAILAVLGVSAARLFALFASSSNKEEALWVLKNSVAMGQNRVRKDVGFRLSPRAAEVAMGVKGYATVPSSGFGSVCQDVDIWQREVRKGIDGIAKVSYITRCIDGQLFDVKVHPDTNCPLASEAVRIYDSPISGKTEARLFPDSAIKSSAVCFIPETPALGKTPTQLRVEVGLIHQNGPSTKLHSTWFPVPVSELSDGVELVPN